MQERRNGFWKRWAYFARRHIVFENVFERGRNLLIICRLFQGFISSRGSGRPVSKPRKSSQHRMNSSMAASSSAAKQCISASSCLMSAPEFQTLTGVLIIERRIIQDHQLLKTAQFIIHLPKGRTPLAGHQPVDATIHGIALQISQAVHSPPGPVWCSKIWAEMLHLSISWSIIWSAPIIIFRFSIAIPPL